MKINNYASFGILACFCSIAIVMLLAFIRNRIDIRRQSKAAAANGYDFRNTEKPFIEKPCNN